MGPASDRRNERYINLAIPLIIGAIGFAASAYVGSPFLGIVCLSIAVMGIIAGYTVFWVVPGTFLTGVAVAGGIALVNSMGNIGGFIAPFAIGWIKQSDRLVYLRSAGPCRRDGGVRSNRLPDPADPRRSGARRRISLAGVSTTDANGFRRPCHLSAAPGEGRSGTAIRETDVVCGSGDACGTRQSPVPVLRDQDDPLNFMLYEEFVDEAALQAHRERPEMATILPSSSQCLMALRMQLSGLRR